MKRLLMPLLLAFASAIFATDALAVRLHGHRFTTEFATNDATRERGLMLRTELAGDHSMLFVFPDEDQRSFWMKNTLIPLDALYFDGSRRLVSVQAGAGPSETDPCPSYPSNRPARYVWELPAGTAAKIGVTLGDELAIEEAVGPVQ